MLMSVFLFLLLPGAFLLFHPIAKKLGVIEILVGTSFFSLSGWICLYTLLKFVPLQLSHLLTGGTLLLAPFFLYMLFKKKVHIQARLGDFFVFLLLCIPFLLLSKIITQQIVPGGSDMATHSYIARVISYYNGFPDTMQPIVPVDHFGFEPVGMPFLIAAFSILSDVPIHTVGLILSVATYPLLVIASYVFLRQFFSKGASLLAAFSTFFMNQHIAGYLTFGAHPTTLSIVFLFVAMFWVAAHMRHRVQPSAISGVVLGVFVSASFTTHQIPLIAVMYFFAPLLLTWVIRHRSVKSARLALFLCVLTVTVFSASFIASIQPISEHTIKYLRAWQGEHEQIGLKGDALSYLITVPNYLLRQTGEYWWILFVPGILLGITYTGITRKIHTFFTLGLFVYFLIILNSQYWFLPLSEILYPDRVTTVATILCVYFVAVTIQASQHFIQKILNHPQPFPQKVVGYLSIFVVLSFFSTQFFKIAKHIHGYTIDDSLKQSSVTTNDLAAMQWIEKHTIQMAVVDNTFSDSGVWIPAIIGRRVLHNDASPHTFDALGAGVRKLIATHAFVGEKTVYAETFEGHHEALTKNGFVLVFQQGESKVYERDFRIKVK